MTDLAPVDDAFIRTAIRGLRAPEHHPAFWTELTNEIDAAEGQAPRATAAPLVVQLPEAPPEQARPPKAPAKAPARPARAAKAPAAPARQVHVAAPVAADPAPPPAEGAEPAPEAPAPRRREPLRAAAPAHAAPAGAERVRAFGPGTPGWDAAAKPPKVKVRIKHDARVVPISLRRASNAVLLAVAAVAATVALVAGLALIRQRTDTGSGPPAEDPTEQPEGPSAAGG